MMGQIFRPWVICNLLHYLQLRRCELCRQSLPHCSRVCMIHLHSGNGRYSCRAGLRPYLYQNLLNLPICHRKASQNIFHCVHRVSSPTDRLRKHKAGYLCLYRQCRPNSNRQISIGGIPHFSATQKGVSGSGAH